MARAMVLYTSQRLLLLAAGLLAVILVLYWVKSDRDQIALLIASRKTLPRNLRVLNGPKPAWKLPPITRVPGRVTTGLIRPGTFLYMGIASTNPSAALLARSCYAKSMLFVMTFLKPLTAVAPNGCLMKGIFFPNSTWTTSRNELLRHAYMLEEEQGWLFEFFVFLDNDVKMVLSGQSDVAKLQDGEELFRKLLLRDRPLRASLLFGPLPLAPLSHSRRVCGRACYTDAAVDAYHRSGVRMLLPYNPALDVKSWYMSAYIVNLKLAAIGKNFCSVYRQITTDPRLTTRAKYPKGSNKGMNSGPEWKEARVIASRQFAAWKVPGFTAQSTESDVLRILSPGLFGSDAEQCVKSAQGVNYTHEIQQKFPFAASK